LRYVALRAFKPLRVILGAITKSFLKSKNRKIGGTKICPLNCCQLNSVKSKNPLHMLCRGFLWREEEKKPDS
jgi:hypothetical protein